MELVVDGSNYFETHEDLLPHSLYTFARDEEKKHL